MFAILCAILWLARAEVSISVAGAEMPVSIIPVAANQTQRRLSSSEIHVSFHNVSPFPEVICFNYGFDADAMNYWAGPLAYGEQTLKLLNSALFDQHIHIDAYRTESSSCSYFHGTFAGGNVSSTLSINHVNIFGWWLTPEDGLAISTWNDEDEPYLAYANVARDYEHCDFYFRRFNTLVLQSGIGYGQHQYLPGSVNCDYFDDVDRVEIRCDSEAASLDLDPDDLCTDVTHVFMAAGSKFDGDYPLAILLAQGTQCTDSTCVQGTFGDSPYSSSSSSSSGVDLVIGLVFMCVLFAICGGVFKSTNAGTYFVYRF